jgi:thymidylate synthase (FAD)
MSVKPVYITPEPIEIIAYAARFSTATQADDIKEQVEKEKEYGDSTKLVRKLIKKGHFACLEFADAMFEIECSRSASHQLVRHRHMSFVQESQRYVKFDRSVEDFIYPHSIINNPEAKLVLNDCFSSIINTYDDLIARGILKEDARFILPNATKTKLVMKGNFRSWREFLTLRLDKTSQWEIREIAKDILQHLLLKAELCFEDFRDYNKKGEKI